MIDFFPTHLSGVVAKPPDGRRTISIAEEEDILEIATQGTAVQEDGVAPIHQVHVDAEMDQIFDEVFTVAVTRRDSRHSTIWVGFIGDDP
jgi:hypothetical protein